MLASAGSLNKSVADSRISDSFAAVLFLLISSQPLLLSQDWASFAVETGLGVAVTCASRLAQGEKSRTF